MVLYYCKLLMDSILTVIVAMQALCPMSGSGSLSIGGQSFRSSDARQLDARVEELTARLAQYENEQASYELRAKVEAEYRKELEGQLLLELQVCMRIRVRFGGDLDP